MEIDGSHLLAAVFVSFVYWRIGDIDRFIAHNIRTLTARGAPDDALASWNRTAVRMRQVYAAKGLAGWSEFMADEISNAPQRVGHGASTAFQRATLYGAAGRFEQAFACLDEGIAIRDPATVYLAVGPQWDPLRADPRFATRLKTLSLPAVER